MAWVSTMVLNVVLEELGRVVVLVNVCLGWVVILVNVF